MDSVTIFNKELEYDFLSGWIKYLRLNQGISQEALAHSICSTSHLCYFEKGEKKLRSEIIESLLIKLGISTIDGIEKIGLLRQNFSKLYFEIETLNYDAAEDIWESISSLESIIIHSPYIIEYKVYEILYLAFLHIEDNKDYLSNAIDNLDKLTLNDDIKYIFLFVSGRFYFKFIDHNESIRRFIEASKLRNTPWLNYQLGYCYCFNKEELNGIYHLDSALKSYIMNGHYLNVIWCHNYLGICYTFLNMYSKAETHFMAALNGAKYFNIENIFHNIYMNITYVLMNANKMKDAAIWAEKSLSLKNSDPIFSASNYGQILYSLGDIESANHIFEKYLIEEHKSSRYYNFLYFNYLYLFHFDEIIFYEETIKTILPFYEEINYHHLIKHIKLGLIEYFEGKRKYKEANKLYKELLY